MTGIYVAPTTPTVGMAGAIALVRDGHTFIPLLFAAGAFVVYAYVQTRTTGD